MGGIEHFQLMKFYAHTANDGFGKPLPEQFGKWQPLHVHLQNVAKMAKMFASPLGASAQQEAELAALLHDLGKYSLRFQQRLSDPKIRGINHWSSGTAEAVARKSITAAFAVEGHHTGMPAFLENDEPTGLEALKERIKRVRDAARSEEANGFPETIAELLAVHASENPTLPASAVATPEKRDFAMALRTRMVFSCLVDADFLDTEAHFDPVQSALRQPAVLLPEHALELLLAHLGGMSGDGPVNVLRRRLLSDCLAASEKPPGLFSLTAPTGSGKTLAGLAFALAHARRHGLRRIIVVIPYTSIIEQTAQVYRDLFEKEMGPDYILEHHSAVAPRERPEDGSRDAESERIRRARLAQENWDAPLIVTTSVQFFESLSGHRPSQCRKLHNIAHSVVLFDEVQTLPVRLVPSLLSTVNLLAADYGVTAVFGTATQPAFASAAPAIHGGWRPVEISSEPRAMADGLRRTMITRRPDSQRLSWAALAEELASLPSALCVVNLKRHASELFAALPDNGNRFHLSSAMCPAHRHVKLLEIRRRLTERQPCLLISTQLIEAGVDVDFPRVYRAAGPLDSIIQSAGRCNREGRMDQPGEVVIFRPEDDIRPPGAYAQAAAITEAFLTENPTADLHLPETYSAYFARLYGTLGPQSAQEDPVFAASENLHFPEAARKCSLVGEDTRSVIVRWGEGERIIQQFRTVKHLSRDDWRLAHRFSVSLYHSAFNASLTRGEIVQPVPEIEFYFWNGHYDEDLGICAPSLNDFNQ